MARFVEPWKPGAGDQHGQRFTRWLEILRVRANTVFGGPGVDEGNVGDTLYMQKLGDTSRQSTIVAIADPELTKGVSGPVLWGLEGEIKISSLDAQGFRFNLDGVLTFTTGWETTESDGAGVVNSGNAESGIDQLITEVGPLQIIHLGGIAKSVESATLAFNWAQETSVAVDTTVHEGSWIRLTRLSSANLPINFDEYMFTLAPDWWVRQQEASGDIMNYGTQNGVGLGAPGTADSATPTGTPDYQQTGPHPAMPAINVSGSGEWFDGNNGAFSNNTTAGSIFLVAAKDIVATSQYIISQSNGIGTIITGINTALNGQTRMIVSGGSFLYVIQMNAFDDTDGLYHTFAFTQDGVSGEAKAYRDGVEQTGTNLTITKTGSATGNEWLGLSASSATVYARDPDHATPYNGRGSHMAIWNGRILTATEILNLHNTIFSNEFTP